MRILLILPSLDSGGVETHVSHLALGLHGRGHHVVLVSGGGHKVRGLEREGLVHYEIPTPGHVPLSLYRARRRLQRVLIREDIEIIHAHARVSAHMAWQMALKQNIPFFTTAHSQYRSHRWSRVMARGQRVFVVSRTVGDHFHAHFQLPRERMVLIPQALDVETLNGAIEYRESVRGLWQWEEDLFVVGSVGRLSRLKGHSLLVEAAAILKEQGRGSFPFRFLIIGEGSHGLRLQRQVEKEGLTPYFRFLPFQAQITPYYGAMDAYVLTSYREGLGLSPLEAMAAGIPCILTSCGGLSREVVEEEEALIIPTGEAEDLAKALKKLLLNPEFRQKLGQAGSGVVQRLVSREDLLNTTISVYEEVLRGGRRGEE